MATAVSSQLVSKARISGADTGTKDKKWRNKAAAMAAASEPECRDPGRRKETKIHGWTGRVRRKKT
jgi:hypothetical protein